MRVWVQADVAALRERAGLTIMAAAKLLGVTRRTWQRWEAAGGMPAGALKRLEQIIQTGGQRADR